MSADASPGGRIAGPWTFGAPVIGAAFVAQGVAIGGSVGIFPLFMESLETEFGATRTQTSFGIPIVLIAGALASPWIGRRLDLGSPRRIMIAGALLMTLGLALVSRAPSLALATLFWVGFVGLGHAMLGVLPATTVLAHWFVARRATVIGIAAMGTTVAGALIPPIAVRTIAAQGWRDALLGFAAAATLIAVPVVWAWIVKRPQEIGAHPDGIAAPPPAPTGGESQIRAPRSPLRDPRFWLLGGVAGPIAGAGIAFLTHVLPLASERGIERHDAALVLTTNAICAALAKVVFGFATDRLGARVALWLALVCMVAGLAILLGAGTTPIFVLGAAVFSLGAGSIMPCQAALVVAIFGQARFGHVSGLVGLLSMVAILALPTTVGVLYDTSGSYDLPMVVIVGGLLVSAALLWLLDPSGEQG